MNAPDDVSLHMGTCGQDGGCSTACAPATKAPPTSAGELLPMLRNVEDLAVTAERPWTLYGILVALGLFGVAVALALQESETLAYLAGLASLGAIVAGLWKTSQVEKARERAARDIFAETSPALLARATVSQQYSERTRVAIVNYLNRHYPGWVVDLASADAAWSELRYARGAGRGCGTSCGSGCR